MNAVTFFNRDDLAFKKQNEFQVIETLSKNKPD